MGRVAFGEPGIRIYPRMSRRVTVTDPAFSLKDGLIMGLREYRSSAPNSLSIWTHHMRGLDFHDSFRPRGCRKSIDTPAITIAAGMVMQEVNSAAALRNLTVVTGGSATVGVGGYITGGGHGAMGPSYGMAADNVLEFEIVTPEGEIMTINECQNKDLFWAMRGVSAFQLVRSALCMLIARAGRRLNLRCDNIRNHQSIPLNSNHWL
jgi:hypothetical protein